MILAELSMAKIKLMKGFWICFGVCCAFIAILLLVSIATGSQDFLKETSHLWYILSTISLIISIVSFGVGCRLIQNDPRFKKMDLKVHLKKSEEERKMIELKKQKEL
jgi:hypothetical protein